jgi:hypothetical protein
LDGDPCLERLDVVAFELGAAVDVGMVFGQPRAEHSKVLLDVFDRRRPQADPHLLDVAQRGLPVARRDRIPTGDRDRRFHGRPRQRVDLAGVEQRELQSVEDRADVASRLGATPTGVRVVDLGPGGEEQVGVDFVGPGPGQGRDLA